VSLAAVAVAVPLGRWASSALLESRGYDPVTETEPPGLGLLAYLLLAAVVLPPVMVAIVNGRTSWRRGHTDAVVVLALAGTVGVVVALGLPLFLSRILGWPLAVVLVAAVCGAGWITCRWGWGNLGPPGPSGSGRPHQGREPTRS
jgi:drug/metabolite transporter (DMT)-like permease